MTAYDQARLSIDKAHAADPTKTETGLAAELVYADRVEAWVARLVPDAPHHLLLAARCQHRQRCALAHATAPASRIEPPPDTCGARTCGRTHGNAEG